MLMNCLYCATNRLLSDGCMEELFLPKHFLLLDITFGR